MYVKHFGNGSHLKRATSMVYEEDRKYQKHSNGKDHLTLYFNVEEKFSNPLSNLEALGIILRILDPNDNY